MNDTTKKLLFHPALKLAIEEAKQSKHQFKIGAVIYKGKRIISSAHNATRANNATFILKLTFI